MLLSACSATDEPEAPQDEQAEGFPLTIDNCGTEVTFDTPPERVMLLESAPVTILDGIGALDRVIARGGSFPPEYYDDELAEAIDDVPVLSEDLDASGHLMISQEEIVAQSPDLVLGLPDGVSRETLSDTGSATLIQELYCPGGTTEATFDSLYEEIERYGLVFDQQEEAEELIDDLEARVAAVTEGTAGRERQSAAVLYPSEGGGPLYAYGSGSMAEPQLEAAGLENVFAESEERVFEVQTEELVSRDPDVLILLYQGPSDGVEESVTSLPGAETISAVADDQVITQLFNFTEPASPLTVEGLEKISERLTEDEQS